MNRLRSIAPLLCAVVLGTAAAGRATTYVLPPDADLVAQAAVVTQATVTAVEPAPIEGPPSTDYFVQIERVLKGHVAGGTIVVRVPGGIGTDGIGLRIWGAPHFREGERLLLFLEGRDDGTYGVLHLMLGSFRELQSEGSRVAVRSLADAVELALTPSGAALDGAEPGRDWSGFLRWIEDAAAGLSREPDYLLDGTTSRWIAAEPPGLLEESCTNLPFRWFEFDREEAVPWRFQVGGFDGAGGGRRSFERARRLWSKRAEEGVRLARATSTQSSTGLDRFDGRNTVTFGDANDLVAGSFRCDAGGIVSLTGLWFDNGRGQSCERIGSPRIESFEGRRFLEILGADIVANDGAECLFEGDSATTTRVLAHELGHALGLAHLGSEEALMWGELNGGAPPSPDLSEADRVTLGRLYDPPPSKGIEE